MKRHHKSVVWPGLEAEPKPRSATVMLVLASQCNRGFLSVQPRPPDGDA
jgi:hypothetical protein